MSENRENELMEQQEIEQAAEKNTFAPMKVSVAVPTADGAVALNSMVRTPRSFSSVGWITIYSAKKLIIFEFLKLVCYNKIVK